MDCTIGPSCDHERNRQSNSHKKTITSSTRCGEISSRAVQIIPGYRNEYEPVYRLPLCFLWHRISMNTNEYMKIITSGIIALCLAVVLASCDSQEKITLAKKVDSLSNELKNKQKLEEQMMEVNILLDSIENNSQLLRKHIVEGTSFSNYATRLKNINQYINTTQLKISALEEKVKEGKGLSSAIRRLKSDLALRSKEVAVLQLEVSRLRSENKDMANAIAKKDSALLAQEGIIKIRETDIISLETMMRSDNDKSRIAIADLYFEQAATWEKVANRTHFAPRKRREAKQEALELYKISLSLGKIEAQEKVNNLEKELS